MEAKHYLGVPVKGIDTLQHRVSYREKKANDWRWLEEWTDYYDAGYDLNGDDINLEKVLLNYRLWNGRGIESTTVSSPISSNLLQEEGLYFNDEDIPHHDILIPIGKSLHGQQQLMSFKPIVTDSSATNVNAKKKKKLELRQQWLNETIVNPIKEQAYQEWMLQNQVKDMQSLSPEQQQEAQQQIEATRNPI